MRQAPKTDYDPIPKGHLHEYSLFGEIKKNNPKYLEAYKKARPDVKGYLPFDKAFDDIYKLGIKETATTRWRDSPNHHR